MLLISYRRLLCMLAGLVLIFSVLPLHVLGAEQPDAKLFSGMKWRLIGPFRAGRVTVVAGVPGDQNTYYFGTPGGGVWKTVDGGQVWHPISDKAIVLSVGVWPVPPSNPHLFSVRRDEQPRGD